VQNDPWTIPGEGVVTSEDANQTKSRTRKWFIEVELATSQFLSKTKEEVRMHPKTTENVKYSTKNRVKTYRNTRKSV
jgi:hypothetical protein